MLTFIRRVAALLPFACLGLAALVTDVQAKDAGYAVVVSQATLDDAEWKPVVDALVERHQGKVIAYPNQVSEALPELRAQFPRYACFVAKPGEANRKFVADVHVLTRQLDEDIYTDVLWGILTGFDAANALTIANTDDPLEVKRVAGGTELALEKCGEGLWYCELKKGRKVEKKSGGEAETAEVPADTTKALVDSLMEYQPQLFVTSGHATERNWMIGYAYKNGFFHSKGGQLYGLDTQQKRFDISAPEPKVYLAVGNCLMGHIDGPDAMALAWMNSAGVRQMVGYTVPTWYGYGGWGLLDYYVEQPGRYSLSEAFYANHQALLHRLDTNFDEVLGDPTPGQIPQLLPTEEAKAAGLTANDARGLLYDRDTVAFYGDPAWIARLAPGDCSFDQTLTTAGNEFQLEITPRLGEKSFAPVNTNGSQRGGRPIVQLLPERIDVSTLKITEGEDLKPVITDNFILIPLPKTCDPNRTYRVSFEAQPL